ncbi:MAG: nitroreductase family protein [Candidatus Woesearchaeota archaeon]
MDVIDAIKNRRCIREYSDKEVEFNKVASLVEAGMMAPSAGNLQNWKFIVITDKDKRNSIAEACVEQYWIADAPVLIAICAENKRAEKYYADRGVHLYNIQNCAAAAENILLAATSMGLSTCWVGAYNDEKVSGILGLPTDAKLMCVLTVGYSKSKPAEKHLLDIKELFYFDEWGTTIKNLDKIVGFDKDLVTKILDHGKKLIAKASEKLKKK